MAIRPEGDAESERGAVDIVHTSPERAGEAERIRYDYLINATGPQLKFGMTPGLGPDGGNTVSVCTADHAVHAAAELRATIERLKAGERQTLVVGMGHGTCTCEGAAFEYVFNVDHELREAGRPRPGPAGLPHQRGPARRLRRRRDDLRRARLRDHLASCGPPACTASAASRRSSARTCTASSRASCTTRP